MAKDGFQPIPESTRKIMRALAEGDYEGERARKEQREASEHRQTESVDIPVGVHEGCDGEIHYRSSFGYAGDIRNMRIGGQNPLEEARKCRCTKCGTLFDPDFALYRDQLLAHRNREA